MFLVIFNLFAYLYYIGNVRADADIIRWIESINRYAVLITETINPIHQEANFFTIEIENLKPYKYTPKELYFELKNLKIIFKRTENTNFVENCKNHNVNMQKRHVINGLISFTQKCNGNIYDWVFYEKTNTIESEYIELEENQVQKICKNLCQEYQKSQNDSRYIVKSHFLSKVYGRRKKDKLTMEFIDMLFHYVETALNEYNGKKHFNMFTNVTNLCVKNYQETKKSISSNLLSYHSEKVELNIQKNLDNHAENPTKCIYGSQLESSKFNLFEKKHALQDGVPKYMVKIAILKNEANLAKKFSLIIIFECQFYDKHLYSYHHESIDNDLLISIAKYKTILCDLKSRVFTTLQPFLRKQTQQPHLNGAIYIDYKCLFEEIMPNVKTHDQICNDYIPLDGIDRLISDCEMRFSVHEVDAYIHFTNEKDYSEKTESLDSTNQNFINIQSDLWQCGISTLIYGSLGVREVYSLVNQHSLISKILTENNIRQIASKFSMISSNLLFYV